MAPDLVTVGGLTIDHVISASGAYALSQPGGNGAYSAVGALMWCERVGLVSRAVATYPAEVLERLEAAGIDMRGVHRSPERLSAGNWFVYDDEGHRNDRYRSVPEALAQAGFSGGRMTPGEVAQWLDILARRAAPDEISYSEFRHRHPLISSQVPADYLSAKGVHLAPSRIDVLRDMVALFAPAGMTITMDAGWQFADLAPEALAPLLAHVDAFLPSRVELEALYPGAGLADALALLAPLCRGTAAVKLGPQGVLVWDRCGGRAVQVPAIPTEALDPTGAGDSFCGGFLAGLVETGDAVEAARFGVISASRIVACFGAQGTLPVDREATRASLADAHAAILKSLR
ncbi:carbohydrate kinase family protein [Aureimonas populi]|uniref:Carbohydrate kinase family protein n=1 Tax=Aureimonas populi TaxID=1701758 RepID=A0ABW5CSI5_9HYPH|nr:carbohydrate kinase family protein [Aureimonas populi]